MAVSAKRNLLELQDFICFENLIMKIGETERSARFSSSPALSSTHTDVYNEEEKNKKRMYNRARCVCVRFLMFILVSNFEIAIKCAIRAISPYKVQSAIESAPKTEKNLL